MKIPTKRQNKIFKLFLENYNNGNMNFTESANCAGVRRDTIYRWLNDFNRYKQRFDNAREEALDEIENKAFAMAKLGNVELIKLILKTKGKDRGYTEKQILVHEDIPAVKIEMEAELNFDDIDKLNENIK